MNNEDLKKLKAAAEGCDGWTWPDRRRDENGTHHFGKRTEDGEFHDMGTIDVWTYTSDYADDLRVLKFIRQAQPKEILALIAEVEQARAAKQEPKYGCHIDLPSPEYDACVLDGGNPADCMYAERYGEEGRKKCGEWKPVVFAAP